MKYPTYGSSWYFRDFSPSAFAKPHSSPPPPPPPPTVHAMKPLPQADLLTVESLISQCNVTGGKLAYACKFPACKSPGKVFMSKENARVHVQHELGYTNLYACTGCDAKFSSKDTAKRHVNTKMGGKQYSCQFCGTCFERKDYRATHVRQQKCIAHRRIREQEAGLRIAIVKTEEMDATTLHPSYHSPSPSQPPSPSYYAPATQKEEEVMHRLREEDYYVRQDAMSYHPAVLQPQHYEQQQPPVMQSLEMAQSMPFQGYYYNLPHHAPTYEAPTAFYTQDTHWHRPM